MKHTRNMVYKKTAESRELYLFAINDSLTYFQKIIPVVKNLARKWANGTYDQKKAVDLWYYASTFASNQYERDFGYSFTVQERYTVAWELEQTFLEDVIELSTAM